MTSTSEWSIQELAKATGATSRTLRHYGERGLLHPSRVGAGGMRYYDDESLPRLLRILLLRREGLGIEAIKEALSAEFDDATALRRHVLDLKEQRRELSRRISSVQRTIERLEGGETLMAKDVFETFDHTEHKEEVERRWGAEAYAKGDAWWRSLSEQERAAFQQEHVDIAESFGELAAQGKPADGDAAQALARRHAAWLGTSGTVEVTADYLRCMGELYVTDPRFAKNYPGYAQYVSDALHAHADTLG